MTADKRKHIAVHINELVLPRGSRMPDQATLRRMVEAQVQRRLSCPAGTEVAGAARASATGSGDISGTIADHVQQNMNGAT